MKRYFKIVGFNLLLIFILLALFEGSMLMLVRNPALLKKCPQRLRNSIGYLYANGDMNIIQFSPDCARHDDSLGYTLKPGECIFSNREYSNRYAINRIGVRDDEQAIEKPEIIVAGDSYAMGWGVEQNEAFPQLLRQKTGRLVLNSAVASYGTAREMMILKQIPTERLKYLIIQYCGNDYDENKEFYLNHNHLPVMTAEKYRHYTDVHRQAKGYYFGKYLWMRVKKRFDERRQHQEAATKPVDKDEVELFLNAVMHAPLDLKRIQLIVFAMNGRHPKDSVQFTDALQKKITSADYPPFIKKMIVLDMTKHLNDDHYYDLDDHIRKTGHEVVADVLQNTIKRFDNKKE